MVDVVEVRDSLPEWFDPRGWPIFAPVHGDVNCVGTLEGAFNVIVNFWSTLAKIRPCAGILKEAMLLWTAMLADHCSLKPHLAGNEFGINRHMRAQ